MVLSAPAHGSAPLLWSKDGWCKAHFRAMGTDCQIICRPPSHKQG
ncbi:MAG: hypothetical protein JWO94_1850, partial [Verrucomicrobiaceae bacterium]|nr:hypothetical protein [Verrucomicrobiaceae bacterium]